MQTETIPLEETDCFSKTFTDYLAGKNELTSFYNQYPSIHSFNESIKSRKFTRQKRDTLCSIVASQYSNFTPSSTVSENIQSLKNANTFTITTGHQLNIFTGPLYFLYKIITAINTCKELKNKFPNYHFVPVYWMASEDHDFEEISYFHFEGKKISWETDQQGAVGRFDPKGLLEIARKLPAGASFFNDAYNESNLAGAVRKYVNYLFGDEGVVVLDGDEADLKKSLIPIIEDDLFHHNSEKLVSKSSDLLNKSGHKTQVTAREINFFYLDNGIRERIERTTQGFHVVDTTIKFTGKEIKKLIQEHPEKFSPNVILRPLYQEIVLPNLAYIGGPSEIIYWLQLKGVFDHFEVPYPIIMPRNFGLILSKRHKSQWGSMGLSILDLFKSADGVFSKWVQENSINKVSYQEELAHLKKIEQAGMLKALQVDSTLVQHLAAIHASFARKLQKAEKKIIRAEKRRHHEKRLQIESVKECLFPGGMLQERKENFLNFYLKDPLFVQKLKDTFDPFNYQMYLLSE